MFRRFIPGIALVAGLGASVIIGAMTLGSTSEAQTAQHTTTSEAGAIEERLVQNGTQASQTQEEQNQAQSVAPASFSSFAPPEGFVIGDGSLNGECDGSSPSGFRALEVPEGFDLEEPPRVLIGEDVDGEVVLRVPTALELEDLEVPAPVFFDDLDPEQLDLIEVGCILSGCTVLGLEHDMVGETPAPPIRIAAPGISVTETDGRVVVTDADGTVLLEADAPDNGMVGFAVEDGIVRQLDDADLPDLAGIEVRPDISGAGCSIGD